MKKRYQITLEATNTGTDPIVRLRKFLKQAIRQYGLRCVRCREEKPQEAQA